MKKLFFLTVALFSFAWGIAQRPYQKAVIHEGIKVGLNLVHLDSTKTPGVFYENDDVLFRFSITDTLSKKGLSGAFPAAWMDFVRDTTSCVKKVASYLTGSIINQAELDLNVYYVLAMNDDATITVVDPLFGYGGTKLLAIIQLNSPGMDWVLTEDQNRLFVSMPDAKQIAVINTASWQVIKNIDVEAAPYDLSLQADEQYLWAGYTEEEADAEGNSGIAVINIPELKLETKIATGRGQHEIVLNDESSYAYVTNSLEGTVSVIDVQSLSKVQDIPTGDRPISLDYSSVADAVYVSNWGDGTISVIDNQEHYIRANVQSESAGIGRLRFAPGERLAFIVNTGKNTINILDAAVNKVIQYADVEEAPDQVVFSTELAYVRHKKSSIVYMIPLDAIGKEGEPVPVVDFPGGQEAPGDTDFPSLADGLVQAPGSNSILFNNTKDETIYFYMEGAAAPMGQFSNYSKGPRAVLVVDRSLEERTPGVYETVARLSEAGTYDVAFFMDVPRFVHCFRVEVQADRDVQMERMIKAYGTLQVEYLMDKRSTPKEEALPVKFRLKDIRTKGLAAGLKDVQIMAVSTSGTWNRRWKAVESSEEGVYTADLELPTNGQYYLYIQCPSRGFSFNNPQYLIVESK